MCQGAGAERAVGGDACGSAVVRAAAAAAATVASKSNQDAVTGTFECVQVCSAKMFCHRRATLPPPPHAEVASLQAELASVKAENASLQADKVLMEADMTLLHAEKASLQAEKASLQAEIAQYAEDKTNASTSNCPAGCVSVNAPQRPQLLSGSIGVECPEGCVPA